MKKYLPFVLLFFLGSCSSAQSESGCAVLFPSGSKFEVAIADNPEKRAEGLMFVEKMDADKGMLFVFDEDDFHSFWMKNTLITLDMIWISSKMKVVHIEENVPPCTDTPCPFYSSMRRARYVLEVNGGTTKKENLSVGDSLSVTGSNCLLAVNQ